MSMDRLEVKVDQIATSLQEQTRNVDKLTLVVQHHEEANKDSKQVIKDIGETLKSLDKRIDGMDGMRHDLKAATDQLGGMRHDIGNLQNVVISGKLLERVVAAETLLKQYEIIRHRGEGVVQALGAGGRALWIFITLGGMSLVYTGLHFFFGVQLERGPAPISSIERPDVPEDEDSR